MNKKIYLALFYFFTIFQVNPNLLADAKYKERHDPGNPTPKKEELMRENLALKQKLEMMKILFEEKERKHQL